MDKEMKVYFPGGKKVYVDYKGFEIKTDQPLYAGGDGEFPAPFDLFLASIATCCGIYVVSFCQKRGISLDNCTLTMKTEKNEETKMIENVIIEIQLPPEFPEKYKNAVIKSVNSCSVKNHILKAPSFDVTADIG